MSIADCSTADMPTLSERDQRQLQQVEKKYQLVTDRTGSVATGRATGFYLYGTGGCGKTYRVLAELDRLEVPYKLFNSRMTGRGLYNALEEFPDEIHVLEDMEQMFRDSGARGVLRSALWWQPSDKDDRAPERVVTWTTHRMEHSFIFSGGIIMTANRPLPEIPELLALKTRITYLHLTVTDNEMMALMRSICLDGYRWRTEIMDAKECSKVCEFIIAECRGMNRSFDVRLLVNSFHDYLQWRDCQSRLDWEDLVSCRVRERAASIREARSISSRAAQLQEELRIAAQIDADSADRQERASLWRERTGKSEQTLYRRLQQLNEDRITQ